VKRLYNVPKNRWRLRIIGLKTFIALKGPGPSVE
jgi:hypothetical protein